MRFQLAISIWFACCVASYGADKPQKVPFRQRTFFAPLSSGVNTAPNPWPQLDVQPSDPELKKLLSWLRNHEYELSTWPPRFKSEAGGIAIIEEWEALQEKYAPNEEIFLKNLDGVLIYSTFLFYGHNIDEPDAGNNGLNFLGKATKRFSKSAYPLMLGGLLNLQFGGESIPLARDLLLSALAKNESDSINAYCLAGLASYHNFACQPNRGVIDYAKSVEICPNCLNAGQKYGLKYTLGSHFSSSAESPWSPLVQARNKTVSAPLLGISFVPPSGWIDSDGSAGEYDPKQALQNVDIPAAKLPNGLIHSLTLFAWTKPKAGSAIDSFLLKFRSNPEMVVMKEIPPMVRQGAITKWYYFESRRPVGDSDVIAGFVARSKYFDPRLWTMADHKRATSHEKVACTNSPGEGGWTEKRDVTGLYHQDSPRARLFTPIETVFIYNASKGTLDYAQKAFEAIMTSLTIDNRAGSQLIQ
jgi:hypothetical protein